MQTLPTHEVLKPLSWLIGKWVSSTGKGQYPTINSFQYCEEIEFTSIGQPMLNYTSKTWHPEKKIPMHLESGFLRIKPGTKQVSFLVAHNFGVTTLEEGEVCNNELRLESMQIARMFFAKNPAVIGLERHYKLNGDTLECVLYMETEHTPLTEHLRATYRKED